MRTPKLDWKALRPLMENLKYVQGKSLTEVSQYLFDNYGKTVTAARLSQIYSGWREEIQAEQNEQRGRELIEEQFNAN